MEFEDFPETDDFRMQTQKQTPIHQVRLGFIKAAVWKNQTETSVHYNTTFERLYKENGDKEEGWKSSDSFGRDDLLLLAKVADQAHSWICAQPREDEKAKTNRK
jgi:hypothetical protein